MLVSRFGGLCYLGLRQVGTVAQIMAGNSMIANRWYFCYYTDRNEYRDARPKIGFELAMSRVVCGHALG